MIIEKAKELGIALSESEEFRAMNEAQCAMETDKDLMGKINEFNHKQSRIMELLGADEGDQAQINALSAQLEALRTELVENEAFVKMLETQSTFQALMQRVNRAIGMCIGADVEENEETGCGGQCSGCSGCH